MFRSPRKKAARCAVLLLFGWIVSVAPAAAQADGELVGTHIVRPGDTLRGITERYLGSQDRWVENWRLNPQIADPDLIGPGQRLRVLLRPSRAEPTARIVTVAGDVLGRPAPIDWTQAFEQDLLVERDGLRTRNASSTVLVFGDGTSLAVTEDSLVFLRRHGRTLQGVDDRSVEIVEGQAEIAGELTSVAEAPEIEIVVGGTVASSRVDDSGVVQARARKSEEGGAAVMVYEGSSEVSAAGQKVEVERGMGTAVPESGPPAPPEELLPPPQLSLPAAGFESPVPNPVLEWSAVDGAASYVVELCADTACAGLIARQTGIPEARLETQDLPVATFFWRVTAVSPSGLDGYASGPRKLTVLSDQLDTEPPTARVTVSGPSIENGGKLYYGPAAQVDVEVTDEVSGVREWRPILNGDESAISDLEQRNSDGWPDGEQQVDVWAVDEADNEATLEGVSFDVDATPPQVTWEVVDWEAAEFSVDLYEPLTEKREKKLEQWFDRRRTRWARLATERVKHQRWSAPWTVFSWSGRTYDDPARYRAWLPLHRGQSSFVKLMEEPGPQPWVQLLAPTLTPPGMTEPAGSQMLRATARDAKAGTQLLSLQTVEEGGDFFLEVEVVDRLGNRSVERIRFDDQAVRGKSR